MKFRSAAVLILVLLTALGAFAQGVVTGSLTGTVTTDGAPLPGATITVTSPALQGQRTAVSDANGNYNLVGLPPGAYTVKVELEGMTTVTRKLQVTLSGTARADAALKLSTVSEAITVTAAAPAVIETTEVQSNFQKKDIDNLPIGRGVVAVANLAPGVTNNGPGGAMQISGGMSSDNLIMVDGATVQDNVRGTARPLYIEDAIQETTVLSGAISAEFGHFTGGVVNSVTKSGGNDFSGSLRSNLSTQAWTAQSAAKEARPASKIDKVYEGTFGGRIVRDRLWFFLAGRSVKSTAPARYPAFVGTNVPIYTGTDNPRYETKFTGQITPQHSVMLNYLVNNLKATNDVQMPAWDATAIDPNIENREDFRSLHYSGIFSNNLLGEVNLSQRQFKFVGLGGDSTDAYAGTPLRTYFSNAAYNGIANSPWFCGVCDNETRDAKLGTAKLTYFVGTKSFGTHNLVAGAERYQELLKSNNYQSASGLTVWIYNNFPVRQPDGTVQFSWGPGDSVESYRVDNLSLGSDLRTDSFFVNDKWDLNKYLSFNLGARYDKTKAVDQAGNPTANENSVSPRLGVTYDPTGNGRFRVGATYGKYVGRLSEGVQDSGSNAGSPNWYGWYYEGEDTFTGTAAQVVKHAVDWWQTHGGFDMIKNPPTDSNIKGLTTVLDGSLKAPGMNEFTLGAGFQYSQNGFVRADIIDREWNNFYVIRTDQQTGRVTQPNGLPADRSTVGNSNDLSRTYRALQLQAQQRLFTRYTLGGSYTYSKLRGNVEGENSGSGPITTGGWIFQYPEYQGFAQNNPIGYLSGDQRHKVRIWAATDFSLGRFGTLTPSILQRYDSGAPYSAYGTLARPTPTSSVSYVSAPQTVGYYFGERGSYRFDNVSRTDLSINYRVPVAGGVELFVKGDLMNTFNEQAQIGGATTVITPRNTTKACGNGTVRCAAFNPFTDTPVEGVNYAILTPELAQKLGLAPSLAFGAPSGAAYYQLPRTYQFSLGVRF